MPASDYSARPNPPYGPVLSPDNVAVMVGSRLQREHASVAGALQLYPSFQTAKSDHAFRRVPGELGHALAKQKWDPEPYLTPYPPEVRTINAVVKPNNPDNYYFDAPFQSYSQDFALPHVRFFETNLKSTDPRREHFGMVVGFPTLFRSGPISEAEYRIAPPIQLRTEMDNKDDDYRKEVIVAGRSIPVMQGSGEDQKDAASRHKHPWTDGFGEKLCKLSFKKDFMRQTLDLCTAADRTLNSGFYFVFMSTDTVGPASPPDCMTLISRSVWHDANMMETLEALNAVFRKKVAYRARDIKTGRVGGFNNSGNTRPVNTVVTRQDLENAVQPIARDLERGAIVPSHGDAGVPTATPPHFNRRELPEDPNQWPHISQTLVNAALVHVQAYHQNAYSGFTQALLGTITRLYHYYHPRFWNSGLDQCVNMADPNDSRLRRYNFDYNELLETMYAEKSMEWADGGPVGTGPPPYAREDEFGSDSGGSDYYG
ncbi:hypothetical protein CALVIDRAFT_569886 [Calocera viscosa TUFC12733]|uniref:Uncharacterized protein n=1 Tax=Calocera viscosa (strain TUFC12733) TaxID=1330018 RepID=A0A167FH19_CALVF|nr:hypothetical protein CALVIDRAFT_569886 [Calocera viscosa TUFC12733]